MEFIKELFNNQVFLAGLIAWTVAQVSKTIIHFIINKKLVLERMVGGGGMPSSHSALVCAVATSVGMLCGAGSIEFAIAMCFAVIVMYDAMNVRMETGRQGRVLNNIIEAFENMGKNISPEERLKELVGHTPFQVLVGAITGIIVAILIVKYL